MKSLLQSESRYVQVGAEVKCIASAGARVFGADRDGQERRYSGIPAPPLIPTSVSPGSRVALRHWRVGAEAWAEGRDDLRHGRRARRAVTMREVRPRF